MITYMEARMATSYVQCQAKKAVKESVQNRPLAALFKGRYNNDSLEQEKANSQ